MLSQVQMDSLTQNKHAIAENTKYDGPSGLEISGAPNKFAGNVHTPLPNPGVSS